MKSRFSFALLLVVLCSTLSLSAAATPSRETWAGSATLPDGGSLPLELEVFTEPYGKTANVRSPAQGVQNIPVTELTSDGQHIAMTLPTLGAQLTLNHDGRGCLKGELKQGIALPVELCPVAGLSTDDYLADLSDSIEAQPDLAFRSADGTWLSGTLYRNMTKPLQTVAIIAQGSGPVDRDGSFGPHKLYRNFALNMATQGIAVFVFDKRGVRRSGGDYASAQVEDFAADLTAAYDYIQQQLSPAHLGLIGHSEGATVVAITASETQPAFVIALGGVGLNGIDAIVLQDKTESLAKGASPTEAAQLQAIARDYYRIVVESESADQRRKRGEQLLASLSPEQQEVYQRFGAATYTLALENINDATLYSILATDPTLYWQSVCAPALILNGDQDVQVPAAENTGGLAVAIDACEHPLSKVQVLKNYNHMFQRTDDGNVELYHQLPDGLGQDVSEIIARWIFSLQPQSSVSH
ncbi:alpha/beta hydrolase [Pseudidiomarina insulisalsae]|uniref:Serine aminopeptidase S33 domain-containing protein n=1 Tax=Pseudidiomarina insulisalsae TaxID=575789 RepID=A0A432YPR1_9GAMM|nr:alpha/beta hydrolase [Pseudidiomarina insulisalsae]RUO63106.1 hypothetical protein CWI71_02470 [Pseudidiomarina insulisalsae]